MPTAHGVTLIQERCTGKQAIETNRMSIFYATSEVLPQESSQTSEKLKVHSILLDLPLISPQPFSGVSQMQSIAVVHHTEGASLKPKCLVSQLRANAVQARFELAAARVQAEKTVQDCGDELSRIQVVAQVGGESTSGDLGATSLGNVVGDVMEPKMVQLITPEVLYRFVK